MINTNLAHFRKDATMTAKSVAEVFILLYHSFFGTENYFPRQSMLSMFEENEVLHLLLITNNTVHTGGPKNGFLQVS